MGVVVVYWGLGVVRSCVMVVLGICARYVSKGSWWATGGRPQPQTQLRRSVEDRRGSNLYGAHKMVRRRGAGARSVPQRIRVKRSRGVGAATAGGPRARDAALGSAHTRHQSRLRRARSWRSGGDTTERIPHQLNQKLPGRRLMVAYRSGRARIICRAYLYVFSSNLWLWCGRPSSRKI